MIGALSYRLRVQQAGRLPASHGILLHAVCFDILRRFSPSLARHVHDDLQEKPLTSAFLERLDGSRRQAPRQGSWSLPAGAQLAWRVTALSDEVLQAFLALPSGAELQIGPLTVILEETIAAPERCADTCLVEPQDLLARCAAVVSPQELTLDFKSTTAFRIDQGDYTWPLPEYVFGSLARRWQRLQMPLELDEEAVRIKARLLLPATWQGRTEQRYFGPRRGALGFTGLFSYRTDQLPEHERLIFLLLAQYAELSGTGRWTGYGLGQTRSHWR